MSRDKRGFTLIELMITTLILTIIISAIYNSLRVGLSVYHREEERSIIFQNARFALREMSKEIKSAYLNPHNPNIKFRGIDEFFGEEDADRLDFVRGYGLRGISYFIDNDPGTPEEWLQREENIAPYISEEESSTQLEREEIATFVKGLNFRYHDGEEWQDSWDSPLLPLAVEITLAFETLPAETFSTVVGPALARKR
jgi:prepilin-type N-terminal cleavage/methylation domain-containing protein